ncbi:MAG: hypothetical protein V1903_09440 [Bacteroidota bacterium]
MIHIEFSEEDSLLALVADDNVASVYDFNGVKQFDFTVTPNGVNDRNLVRFMHSDNGLIAAVNGNSVMVFDKTGKIVYKLTRHNQAVNSIDISPDGKFIVTASSDKIGFVWNYNAQIKNFSVYDSLSGHNGRIWSCRFNKTGKYIITSAEDSTVRIWDLMGNQINPQFRYIIRSNRARFNNREEDEDRTNPYYSKYYGKFCDAVFSPSELEIIATGYKSYDASGEKNEYYRAMFFHGSGGFPYAYNRIYFLTDTFPLRRKPVVYNELLISPDEKIAAVIPKDSLKISLITGWGIQIKIFPGNNPIFSVGGKEIYWTSGNSIHKLPIHPNEIRRILEKFRITSTAVKKENNLMEI